ncbi:MAG: mechanosensitive ion channel [Proteobacteria bacterium]|nr:mechanosensitive ion channel [Pseudomonadota bacterium]
MPMRRLLLLLSMWLLSAAGVARAEGDWTGTWETHWRDSGGQMILEQEGDTVIGRYPLQHGRIEGKTRVDVRGSLLEGRWFVGTQSGKFIAVLSRDKRTFTGRLDDSDWWTGVRTLRPDPPPRIDLTSPREAFTSFVIAGNRARSGNDDSWGAAAEAIDFGKAPGLTSRSEQLRHVRSLFALIDLTTFRYGSIPDPPSGADSATLRLEQLRSNVVLTLAMRRDGEGKWRILVPSDDEMRATRTALLAVHGGKPPAADAFRRLQNPRDTMRAFLEGMADWDGNGRALALATLDLSGFPELLRRTNGEVSAHFLRRVSDCSRSPTTAPAATPTSTSSTMREASSSRPPAQPPMRHGSSPPRPSPTFATSTSSPSASRHRGPRRRGSFPKALSSRCVGTSPRPHRFSSVGCATWNTGSCSAR